MGLGAAKEITAEHIRSAAGIAYQSLKASKSVTAGIWLDSVLKTLKNNPALVTQALVEGLCLAAYEFTEMKSKPKQDKKDKPTLSELQLFSKNVNSSLEKALQKAVILSDCQNFARRLGDLPGNYLTPKILAELPSSTLASCSASRIAR